MFEGITSGLKGALSPDWNWEAAANYNRIKQEYSNPGVINNAMAPL